MRLWIVVCARGVLGCHAAHAPPTTPSHAPIDEGPPIESATFVTKTYEYPTQGDPLPTAAGIVRIRAPIDVTYAEAVRFKRYWELSPYLIASTEIAKNGNATDLYIRTEPLFGWWATLRFVPVDRYAYDGKMIDGNMDDLHIAWRLFSAGSETIARLEVHADPPIFIPRKVLAKLSRNGVCIMLERFKMHVESPEVDASNLDQNLPCMLQVP